jgi:NADH pyrophosphatase NudC (nudix superfamily)
MKIKMLTSMAGSDFVLTRGEETERFGDAEAARIIAAGFAEPVESIERAVKRTSFEKRGNL